MSTCISRARRDAHVASELFSVFVTAPFLWWIGGKPSNATLGAALRMLAVGEAAIDAYLLTQWRK